MNRTLPIVLRLSALPVVAGCVVVAIALVSYLDLFNSSDEEVVASLVPSADNDELEILSRPRSHELPTATALAELTAEEARQRLGPRPGRAALDALWPLPEYRADLMDLLDSADTAEEARLFLLGRLQREAPEQALLAARSIAQQQVSQGPLLYSAYEILAQHGEHDDLELLTPREHERPQTTAYREDRFAALSERLQNDG